MEAQAAQGTRGAPGGGLGALAGACGGLLAGGIGWRWLRRGEVRPAAALPRAEQSGARRGAVMGFDGGGGTAHWSHAQRRQESAVVVLRERGRAVVASSGEAGAREASGKDKTDLHLGGG